MDRQKKKKSEGQIGRQTNRQTDIDKQTGRDKTDTEKQTDRQINKQTDRQTNKHRQTDGY